MRAAGLAFILTIFLLGVFAGCAAGIAWAAPNPAKVWDLQGPYPTTKQCRAYDRSHAGVEGWRLWVRRNAWRQARNVLAHRPGWRYVWNENWVLPIAKRESGGNRKVVNPRSGCEGPMQLLPGFAHGRDLSDVQTNFGISSMLFSRSGPVPWLGAPGPPVSPYARRLK